MESKSWTVLFFAAIFIPLVSTSAVAVMILEAAVTVHVPKIQKNLEMARGVTLFGILTATRACEECRKTPVEIHGNSDEQLSTVAKLEDGTWVRLATGEQVPSEWTKHHTRKPFYKRDSLDFRVYVKKISPHKYELIAHGAYKHTFYGVKAEFCRREGTLATIANGEHLMPLFAQNR